MDTKEKLLVFAQLYISNLVVRAFGKWYIGSNDVLFSNISKLSEPVSVFLHGLLMGYSVYSRPIASSKWRFSSLCSEYEQTGAVFRFEADCGRIPETAKVRANACAFRRRRSHLSAGQLSVDRPTALWDNEAVRNTCIYL